MLNRDVKLLENYVKELKEMIKLVKDLIFPDIWKNIYGEVSFLERFCHLNGLKKEFEVIWDKYKEEIKKEFFSFEILERINKKRVELYGK